MNSNKINLGLLFSALLLSVSLYFGVQTNKELEAYQFTGISTNTDANRHRQLLWVYNSDNVAHENGDVR